ncbi:MAG: ATP-binding protein [Saprospiraceae bacterium]|nr:ATP-binding protein [Saprospiraceae bacterium]
MSKRKHFLLTMLFVWSVASFDIWAQSTIPQLIKEIETAPDAIQKVQLLNALADTLMWMGDGTPYNAEEYLQEAAKICGSIDCAEWENQTKILQTHAEVNSGKYDLLKSFAFPLLKSNEASVRPVDKALLYETLCLYSFFEGHLDSAKYYIQQSEKTLKAAQLEADKRMGSVYEYLGFYYSFKTVHDTSLIYMNQAADFHLQRKDTLAHIKTLKFLSSFYNLSNEEEKSLTILQQAQELIQVFPPAAYQKHRINAGIAISQIKLDYLDQAEATLLRSIQELQDDAQLKAEEKAINFWDFFTSLSKVYIKKEQPDLAEEYLQKARLQHETHKLPEFYEVSMLIYDIEISALRKQYEQMNNQLLDFFDLSEMDESLDAYHIRVAKIINDIMFNEEYLPTYGINERFSPILDRIIEKNKDQINEDLIDAFQVRGILNILRNNQLEAIRDMQQSYRLQDSLRLKENKAAINEYLAQFEADKKDQLLKIQALELQNTKLQNRSYFFLSLVFGILTISLLYLFFQRNILVQKLETQVETRTTTLKEANKELGRVNQELATFNYVASHDIKEPIRHIGNYVGLIRKKLSTDQQQELNKYFETIQNSSQQLYTLIEDIAQYSLLSQKKTGQQEEVSLTNLVENIKDGFPQSNTQLVYSHLPVIQSNKALLFVILKNLVENGFQHNDAETPIVTVQYHADLTHHFIKVIDNGKGIEKRFQEQIFTLFKKLEYRSQHQGPGIGLATAKLAVQKLHGEILVESIPSQGSTFTIKLPK